MSESKK